MTNTILLRKCVIYGQKKFYDIGPRVGVPAVLVRYCIDYNRKKLYSTGPWKWTSVSYEQKPTDNSVWHSQNFLFEILTIILSAGMP
jgi:hypothetical protein